MRLIKGLMMGVAVMLPLALCFVTVHQAYSSCSGSCCGALTVAWTPTSSNVTASSGAFSTTVTFSWCWTDFYRSSLYLGTASDYGTGDVNIASASYSPSSFIPDKVNCCAQGISIQISGTLTNSNVDGTLKSYGDMSFPGPNYTIHTTNIAHG